MESENQSTTKTLNDLKDSNSSSIQDAKESLRIEKQTMETKMKEALQKKIESFANQELLKEKYETLKQQKDQEDDKNHVSIRELKDQYQKKVEQ